MAVLRIDNRIACCGFVNVLEDSGLDRSSDKDISVNWMCQNLAWRRNHISITAT